MLEKKYDDAIRNKGDIDGRVLVNEDDKLLGSESIFGGAWSFGGPKSSMDGITSQTKSISTPVNLCKSSTLNAKGTPVRTKMADTPVTTAMTIAKWL
ncbi:Retinoblastoma- protein 1 [Dionaea muscipula]